MLATLKTYRPKKTFAEYPSSKEHSFLNSLKTITNKLTGTTTPGSINAHFLIDISILLSPLIIFDKIFLKLGHDQQFDQVPLSDSPDTPRPNLLWE